MPDSVTRWTAAPQASLSFTISRSLLKLMSMESVMPSNHLILCHPLFLPSIFPSIRVFSNEPVLHIRWPKSWSFSFSLSFSNEYSGLNIPLGLNIQYWIFPLGLRDSQESSPTPQFRSINSLVLSFLYGPFISLFIHMIYIYIIHVYDGLYINWSKKLSWQHTHTCIYIHPNVFCSLFLNSGQDLLNWFYELPFSH